MCELLMQWVQHGHDLTAGHYSTYELLAGAPGPPYGNGTLTTPMFLVNMKLQKSNGQSSNQKLQPKNTKYMFCEI